jgi:hypothetical protein
LTAVRAGSERDTRRSEGSPAGHSLSVTGAQVVAAQRTADLRGREIESGGLARIHIGSTQANNNYTWHHLGIGTGVYY